MTEKKKQNKPNESPKNLPAVYEMWPVVEALIAAYPKLTESERAFIEKDIRSSLKRILVAKEHKAGTSMESMENKIAAMGSSDKTVITITEGPDNAYFILNINSKTKSFNLDEMKKMVKIAHQDSEGSLDSALKLYRWFESNRKDVIFDLELKKNDARLFEILQFLAAKYTTR